MDKSKYLMWSPLKKERGYDRQYHVYPISGPVGNVNASYATYYPSTLLFSIFLNVETEGETDIKFTRKVWHNKIKSLLGFEGGYILCIDRLASRKGKHGIHIEFYTNLIDKPSDEAMKGLIELFNSPVPEEETKFGLIEDIVKKRKKGRPRKDDYDPYTDNFDVLKLDFMEHFLK